MMLIIGLEWGSDQGDSDQDGPHRWRSKTPLHFSFCLDLILILFLLKKHGEAAKGRYRTRIGSMTVTCAAT